MLKAMHLAKDSGGVEIVAIIDLDRHGQLTLQTQDKHIKAIASVLRCLKVLTRLCYPVCLINCYLKKIVTK